MPRYNIEHNGKWACFSSISDGFITAFLNKDEYEEWRKIEYGLSDYKPAEECNLESIKYAVSSILMHRNHKETLKCLLECGLSKSECKELINKTKESEQSD